MAAIIDMQFHRQDLRESLTVIGIEFESRDKFDWVIDIANPTTMWQICAWIH